jgi:hypothetical protein
MVVVTIREDNRGPLAFLVAVPFLHAVKRLRRSFTQFMFLMWRTAKYRLRNYGSQERACLERTGQVPIVVKICFAALNISATRMVYPLLRGLS